MKTSAYQTNTEEKQLAIQIVVKDYETNKSEMLEFRHTQHSHFRSAQRGICNSKISLAIEHGTTFFKQGFVYYVLGEKNIPKLSTREKSHIINTVVIVCGDSNQVVTCYRSKNPIKHIKHKSKMLFKN